MSCPHCAPKVTFQGRVLGRKVYMECPRCRCLFDLEGELMVGRTQCPAVRRMLEEKFPRRAAAAAADPRPWWAR